MAITKQPLHPIASFPLPKHLISGTRYHVQDGDNWWNVADRNGIEVWNLIQFNFETRDSDEVNWYLQKWVGCRLETDDHKNFRFSSNATPGFIYIPKQDYSFEGDDINVDSRTSLQTRWDRRKDDIKAGRGLLFQLLRAAHTEASKAASLPELRLGTLCDEAEDFVDNPFDPNGTPTEPGHGLGDPMEKLFECLPGMFENIGRANQARQVNRVRGPLYYAFAEGVASVLDPSYQRMPPKGDLPRRFFEAGQREARKLTHLQRYKLRLALVENARNYGLAPAAHFSETVEAFEKNWSGATFSHSIMNELATTRYSAD